MSSKVTFLAIAQYQVLANLTGRTIRVIISEVNHMTFELICESFNLLQIIVTIRQYRYRGYITDSI